jgi:hypothetical protein
VCAWYTSVGVEGKDVEYQCNFEVFLFLKIEGIIFYERGCQNSLRVPRLIL